MPLSFEFVATEVLFVDPQRSEYVLLRRLSSVLRKISSSTWIEESMTLAKVDAFWRNAQLGFTETDTCLGRNHEEQPNVKKGTRHLAA